MIRTPHTPEEIKLMLQDIGVSSIEELFAVIPESQRSTFSLLKKGKSEFETLAHIRELAVKNYSLKNFVGGGFYDHYIPSAVDALASKPEFYTSYTPYQPECSQGTLQAIYEYQTAICRITSMEAANASVYDGGTALAESVLMALRITKKRKIIIDSCVNPVYRNILKTYLRNIDCELIEITAVSYSINISELKKELDNNTAVFVFQNPNFFGTVEDLSEIIELVHEKGALAVGSFYPVSLGVLKSPGEMDVDIASGEGQSLGNALNFGGPYFGYIACKKKYIRHLPGRIVGATKDVNGKRGFVLTLQAREQHIRRFKATSNICSNQNHCILRALIYLSCLGKVGFEKLAMQNYDKANNFKDLLLNIPTVNVENKKEVFNEFVVSFSCEANQITSAMLEEGIFAGLPLNSYYENMENKMLVCVTEKTSYSDIQFYIDKLKKVLVDK